MNDPIEQFLLPLQSLDWNRPKHQQTLENRIMIDANKKRGFLGFFTSSSPAVAAAILLLVGGAVAATSAVVSKWIVTEEPVGETQKHVVVKDEDGNVVIDDILDNDMAIFTIDGEDGEDDVLLTLEKTDIDFVASEPAANVKKPEAK
jgi:hypothetical protein